MLRGGLLRLFRGGVRREVGDAGGVRVATTIEVVTVIEAGTATEEGTTIVVDTVTTIEVGIMIAVDTMIEARLLVGDTTGDEDGEGEEIDCTFAGGISHS
jgi:hypothetical protein